MPASGFSAGPAHCYVGINNSTSKAPVYLGTGRGRPKIRINRKWVPLMNDIAGDEPYDWSYMGQGALVMYQLTRWDDVVYRSLASAPNPFRGAGLAGTEGADFVGDLGTLIGTEGMHFPVWIAQPYGTGKAAYAAVGHHAGWRFQACFFMGPDELERGTAPAEVHVVFYAMRNYYATTTRAFVCYDHNMVGLATVGGMIVGTS